MKLATASTLALALATTGALAANHATANTETDAEVTTETSNIEAGKTGMSTEHSGTETASMGDMPEKDMMKADLIRTRDITGGAIYTTDEASDEGWDPARTYDTVGSGWNEIGSIEDIILSKSGKMVGVVGEVGGFLDIGDKHVMIKIEDVSLVAVDDRSYAYVTRLSEEDFEAMKTVDEGFWN